ncbi:hypothetical protein HAZT_HAZT001185, partial [Hyalella azteca]
MEGQCSTVLVTGGAGYAGSHTVLVLLQWGYQVKDICQKAPVFYQAALDDGPALLSIFKKVALKAVGESVQKPLMYYHNNLLATISLLEYLPIDEDHPVGQSITNPYGHTKHMCEQILRDIVQSNNDWKVILLRYFNPVGAHESGKMGEDPIGVPNNLMPFIAQVAVGRREKLSIFGNDFDTDDGTGSLLSDDFRGCRAYNLGTGVGVSVMQMLQAFQKSCGRSLPYEVVARRAGDCARMLASCTRARTELGWTATRTLQDMCEWQDTAGHVRRHLAVAVESPQR